MKHVVSSAIAMLIAGAAQAGTVQLGFDQFGAADCNVTQYAQDGLEITRPSCNTLPLVVLEERDGAETGLSVAASSDQRMDLLGFDLIYAEPEILSVAAEDLPDDFNPNAQADYDQIWQDNLWELTPGIDNLRITGFRDRIVVAEEYFALDYQPQDSDAFLELPNAEVDFGSTFVDLDRIEIANRTGFEDAIDFGLSFVDGRYYTCLGSCGFLVIDNLRLDVSNAGVVTPPAPIPLPATGWLLLGGLSLSGLRRRRG